MDNQWNACMLSQAPRMFSCLLNTAVESYQAQAQASINKGCTRIDRSDRSDDQLGELLRKTHGLLPPLELGEGSASNHNHEGGLTALLLGEKVSMAPLQVSLSLSLSLGLRFKG